MLPLMKTIYGKALFYWFFEATQKPEKKPLLLWLNGDNRSLDVQGETSPTESWPDMEIDCEI